MKKLELLAPAKNLECGIAAIDHGADAVYIGAPRFGARSAAGNSLEDIKQLCDYAHQFGAKVHVTVNTIIYEEEFDDTLKMIADLDKIGVDALLLQDMGVLWAVRANNLWSRELHASTQCDTRTPDKVFWLSTVGFNRVVLARELSLKEIKAIHDEVSDVELEVFVHGALCVSYSGVCYASEKCFDRSANRGECAQFCRMKFDLLDSNDQEIEHQRYLLSLKDLCQIDHLKELADAGACSFKIEGRLKDINYVKNVVSAYSEKLDEIVEKNPTEYYRASQGQVETDFVPNLKKTFNRGFTNYFLRGRQPNIASFDTPKAMGEYVGKVKEIRGNISFNVSTLTNFSNGDGLCFINDDQELEGFRVNRVMGNRLFPFKMPEHLRPGISLYRNSDRAFEGILSKKIAQRKVLIGINLKPMYGEDTTVKGITATAYLYKVANKGLANKAGTVSKELDMEKARRPQDENMVAQVSKLGDTVYRCEVVNLLDGIGEYFVPNSVLVAIRRELVEKLDAFKSIVFQRELGRGFDRLMFGGGYVFSEAGEHCMEPEEFVWNPEYGKWGYLYNIANECAKHFYAKHGLGSITPAFELSKPKGESLIMQCRHCIRYSLGYCVKRGGQRPTWKEPLFLRLGDGRKFRLEFACNECQMNVYSE